MSFAKQIQDFGKKAIRRSESTKIGTALSLFASIVQRTPVGNPDKWETKYPPKGYTGGRLRANWQISINRPASGEIEGTINIGEEKNAFAAKGDDSIFITNNLDYARAIEYGHSKHQAPKGMVRVTLRAFRRMVKRNARK